MTAAISSQMIASSAIAWGTQFSAPPLPKWLSLSGEELPFFKNTGNDFQTE
jgi:hypothetical protein